MTHQEESGLRLVIGWGLNPGPSKLQKCFWREGGRCYIDQPERESDGRSTKFCPGDCDIDRPWSGSFADAVERLLEKVVRGFENGDYVLRRVAYEYLLAKNLPEEAKAETWWFAYRANPEDRCRICLRVLAAEGE